MGLSKSDKELREETRARRAKHDLKNTPLPMKRRGSPGSKKLFSERKTESNRLRLSRLTNTRVATGNVNLLVAGLKIYVNHCEKRKKYLLIR